MSLIVKFTVEGERDFRRLGASIQKRVVKKLRWLENNFYNAPREHLSYELGKFYKLRVGSWRVIYEIDYEKQYLIILKIEPRDKVYK